MSALPTVPGRVVRLGEGRVSARLRLRPIGAAGCLALAVMALTIVEIGTGDFPLSMGQVVATLAGGGDEGARFIVTELRLPRVACALLAGAALGISGAIFQSLTRNPLGSPDIVGFQAGAVTGALVVITVLGGAELEVSGGALVGGAATATAVYLLARRGGRLSGFRLVLIGIGVSALMLATNDYLLSRARIEDAQEATRWLLGSLNGRTWDDVRPMALALVVLLPLAALAGRSLRLLELGDDAAQALGLGVERARGALVALGVALVAVSTTAVGPIAFVALTAPQIARRLARTAEPSLLCSALTGALLVQGADVAAQWLVPETPLPVGVMTGALGGVYLIWLLGTELRSGRA
ncbi:MAG: iron-siderophore transport system permease protein [Solirubrobacteraceae bacterium]|nr:iron-siderophore transport system permease protein [Solirubrobacteraceae bacterium]